MLRKWEAKLRTIVRTVEFIDGEYKGIVFEKIIPLTTGETYETKIGQTFQEDGLKLKVLNDKFYEDFNPVEYAKTAKPIKLK